MAGTRGRAARGAAHESARYRDRRSRRAVDDEALERHGEGLLLVEACTDLDYGARPLKRSIEKLLEDPLSEDDFDGFAALTQELGVQVVGDDLFVTTPSRVQHGIDLGAANTVLLKVNQIGTISEAFEMVRLAHSNGYGVMPCSSRGEGEDIADYCVGLNVGTVRESGVGRTGNRMLQIEAELGARARFAGKKGLKGAKFQ